MAFIIEQCRNAGASHRSVVALAGLLALIVGGAPARAADVPVLKVPPSVVAKGWGGFYGGFHAGFGWGKKKWLDNFPVFDGEVDADTHVQGGLFGLQAGYNHQINWLVLGVEADFTWSDVKRHNFECFSFGDQFCSSKPGWFATVAGRIGIANGMSLAYLKGGAAWAHDRFTNIATCAGNQPIVVGGISADCGVPYFADQTRIGWLIGAGIERFFARSWSVKLEYNYMDFGGRSVPFGDGGGGFFTEEIHQKIQVVKVGINYHFEWDAPVHTNGAVFKAKAEDEPSYRGVAFSSFDVSKYNYSALAGVFIAPIKDLDTSGPRFLILGEGGTYKYPADSGFINGIYVSGDALAGYGFEGDNYSINVLAGINAVNHMLSAVDPDNRVQGTAFGAKMRADAWVNPTSQTLSYGEAEYSTAFRTYYGKLKFGYDISSGMQVFVGPEVTALGSERSNQWRVGAHVTQLKIGRMQVEVSGGYANDDLVGSSAYGNVEVSTNF